MSTTTTAVQTGTLPRVNLLPPEIAEGAKFRTAQMVMGLGVLASVVLVAGLWYLASSDQNNAQDELNQAQATGQQLQEKVNTYNNVQPIYDQNATAHAQLTQAMSQQIRYSYVLNDLSLGMPTGVWLTNITISQQADTPGVAKGAWGTPTLGSVVLTGNSSNVPQVAGWLQALAAQKSYTDPYLTTVQAAGSSGSTTSQYEFTSSVGLSEKALTNTYAPKAGS